MVQILKNTQNTRWGLFWEVSASKKRRHRYGYNLNFIIRYFNPNVTTDSRSYFHFKYYTPRRVTYNVIPRPVWPIEYFETGSERKRLVWYKLW
jgi:hypothetical protein